MRPEFGEYIALPRRIIRRRALSQTQIWIVAGGDLSSRLASRTEPITERIGMCRIGETIPHAELTVVIPPPAAPDLNAALAVERQHVIGPCSEAARR